MKQRVLLRALRVRLALFDVDGVLTDGRVYLSATGETFKAFHILDGLGLKMLAASGVTLGAISGRKSAAAARRARETGLAHLMLGVDDKLAAYRKLLRRLSVSEEETAYMGDDLPDLPVLRRCGLALSVPGAADLVRAHAHYVTMRPGGEGAVREVCELIMHAQGTLDGQQESYLA